VGYLLSQLHEQVQAAEIGQFPIEQEHLVASVVQAGDKRLGSGIAAKVVAGIFQPAAKDFALDGVIFHECDIHFPFPRT
jgi:hypothetical protein